MCPCFTLFTPFWLLMQQNIFLRSIFYWCRESRTARAASKSEGRNSFFSHEGLNNKNSGLFWYQLSGDLIETQKHQQRPPDLTSCMCYFAGLDTDGIYRVSGNLAVIQKLRFMVNHGEDEGEEGGKWAFIVSEYEWKWSGRRKREVFKHHKSGTVNQRHVCCLMLFCLFGLRRIFYIEQTLTSSVCTCWTHSVTLSLLPPFVWVDAEDLVLVGFCRASGDYRRPLHVPSGVGSR